mmetsp:Transcript_39230/g.78400  ORF Transcript_39230/g.78400 Transcript_39230/m.78400 type:complete len:253 (-) Transcript_39230:86-844(-)
MPTLQWSANTTGYVRITFRFAGLTRFIRDDKFAELRRPTRPNYHLLQLGSWEHANFTTPQLYAQRLYDAVHSWKHAAASMDDGGQEQPTTRLVFATMPFRYTHADVCGRWHETLWAKWTNLTAGITLLNRIRTGSQLEDGLASKLNCTCLSLPIRNSISHSMRYHAPHLHNLWDVQELMNLLLPASPHTSLAHPHGGAANASDVHAAPATMTLAQDPTKYCCCRAPPTVQAPKHPLSMWANLCRIMTAAKSR